MRRGHVAVVRPARQHVAEVDDQAPAGASTIVHSPPSGRTSESGDAVGGEQRDQSVVGVRIGEHGRLAVGGSASRLVVEHPQEALRVAHAIGEERRREVERRRQRPQQVAGDVEHRLLVSRDDVAERGQVRGDGHRPSPRVPTSKYSAGALRTSRSSTGGEPARTPAGRPSPPPPSSTSGSANRARAASKTSSTCDSMPCPVTTKNPISVHAASIAATSGSGGVRTHAAPRCRSRGATPPQCAERPVSDTTCSAFATGAHRATSNTWCQHRMFVVNAGLRHFRRPARGLRLARIAQRVRGAQLIKATGTGGCMAATTATGYLSFDDIGMVFPDGTEAIRDVSFTVDKGEFVTVVGPSGCGKSTLLKIASGLLDPTRGTVLVDRDRLGYVFQDPTLLPWRTVQQNVELLPELHGIGKAERAELADAGDRDGRPEGLRAPLPEVAVRRHAHALLAGAHADAQSAAVPVRRAVRRRRRDHPRAPQRGDPTAVRLRGLRRAVHHPLDQRGGVPQHARAGDVGPSRVGSWPSSTCRSTTRATPTCASSQSSPGSAASCRTLCEVRTHEYQAADRRTDRRGEVDQHRRSSSARPTHRRAGEQHRWRHIARGRAAADRARARHHRRLVLRLVRDARGAAPVPPAPAAPGHRRRASSSGRTSTRSSRRCG